MTEIELTTSVPITKNTCVDDFVHTWKYAEARCSFEDIYDGFRCWCRNRDHMVSFLGTESPVTSYCKNDEGLSSFVANLTATCSAMGLAGNIYTPTFGPFAKFFSIKPETVIITSLVGSTSFSTQPSPPPSSSLPPNTSSIPIGSASPTIQPSSPPSSSLPIYTRSKTSFPSVLHSNSSKPVLSTGAIVGLSVGATVVLALLAGVFLMLRRSHIKKQLIDRQNSVTSFLEGARSTADRKDQIQEPGSSEIKELEARDTEHSNKIASPHSSELDSTPVSPMTSTTRNSNVTAFGGMTPVEMGG